MYVLAISLVGYTVTLHCHVCIQSPFCCCCCSFSSLLPLFDDPPSPAYSLAVMKDVNLRVSAKGRKFFSYSLPLSSTNSTYDPRTSNVIASLQSFCNINRQTIYFQKRSAAATRRQSTRRPNRIPFAIRRHFHKNRPKRERLSLSKSNHLA